MARRSINVFSLSFLDAMTCGFGAVVLFFMVINASVGVRADRMTSDLSAEVDRLEREVLDGARNLVELRNAVRDADDRTVVARGLSRRLIEQIEEIRTELSTYDADTVARRASVQKLQADLRSLEEDAKRLSAATPSDDAPGDRTRSRVGDGNRQYLTGLTIGGERVFILVDTSASMLGDTVVNIVRRRNLPDKDKARARKWRQAVDTVDWLTTQIPRASRFQVYAFAERARPVIAGSEGRWLDGGSRDDLQSALDGLDAMVPDGGTNLWAGFEAMRGMSPPPDNVILLVDGLPTMGKSPARRATVTGDQRLKLYEEAVGRRLPGVPVNIILFPMEGDPLAAASYWKLAVATRGSFLSPPEDWP